MERAIRDAVLTSVQRTMDQAVTPDTLRAQELGRKKVVECIAAIKCTKTGMMETCGTNTDIFLKYKMLDDKSEKLGESSFLIKKPYTQDGYVFSESKNTKFRKINFLTDHVYCMLF
jgi:hypothetical protein